MIIRRRGGRPSGAKALICGRKAREISRFGVGMDSIKRYAKDWRLFDDGKLPTGHFHSTPLQLVRRTRFSRASFLALDSVRLCANFDSRNSKLKTQNSKFRKLSTCQRHSLGLFRRTHRVFRKRHRSLQSRRRGSRNDFLFADGNWY